MNKIPKGLPSFSILDLGTENLEALVTIGIALALIVFTEKISFVKAIHKVKYNKNK